MGLLPRFAADGLELQISISSCRCCNTGKGCIQLFSQMSYLGRSIQCVVQCAAHYTLGILPFSLFRASDTRIGISDTRNGKDISTLYRFMPGINGRKNISSGIYHFPNFIQDVGLPGFRNHASRCVLHGGFGPVWLIAQPVHSLCDMLPPWACSQVNTCGDIEEQLACATPTRIEFVVRFRSCRLDQAVDGCHGALDAVFWPMLVDSISPFLKRHILIGDQHPGQIAQQQSRLVQLTLMRRPICGLGLFNFAEQIRNQRFAKLCSVILRRGFKRVEQSRDRRGAPRFLQRCDRRGFGSSRNTRQALQLRARHTFGGCQAQPELTQRIQPVQMAQKIRLATLQRTGAQDIQSAETLPVIVKQRFNLCALRITQTFHQALPQAQPRSFPDATDKAFQGGNTRQEYLAGDQPVRGPFNEMPRPVLARPTKSVDSPRYTQNRAWSAMKISIPKVIADHCGVAFICGTRCIEIPLKSLWGCASQLSAEIGDYSLWYVPSLVGKRSNKFHATQKHREPQPIGHTAHLPGRVQLSAVKMKISRQLLRGRRPCETPEGLPLLSGQKRCRHNVRNSKVLRQVQAARKTQDKSFAKHVCEINYFCNMIRTAMEVAP